MPLVEAGGCAAGSLAELAAACDAVQVLVVNAAQTEAVLFGEGGLAAHLKPGSVVICSATVDPALPPRWEQRLAEAGLWLIDGPVSGGPKKAAEGEMTVMASGRPEAFAAAGHGAEDDSAVIKFYAALAGLKLPTAPAPS